MTACVHYRDYDLWQPGWMSCPQRKIAMKKQEAETYCKTCPSKEEA